MQGFVFFLFHVDFQTKRKKKTGIVNITISVYELIFFWELIAFVLQSCALRMTALAADLLNCERKRLHLDALVEVYCIFFSDPKKSQLTTVATRFNATSS